MRKENNGGVTIKSWVCHFRELMNTILGGVGQKVAVCPREPLDTGSNVEMEHGSKYNEAQSESIVGQSKYLSGTLVDWS